MSKITDILKNLSDNRGDEIEQWFVRQRAQAEPFFYTSVDLRHSGLRLVPVDTNLFPAGFNNLSPAAQVRASGHIKNYIHEHFPDAEKALIIPENHTRNLPYFDNLAVLSSLLEKAGMETKIGSLAAPAGEILNFTSAQEKEIQQYPLKEKGGKLMLENGFNPDLIIMNNDMSSGVPDMLQNISQPIIPPTNMGWFRRRKSAHFAAYKKLAENFCAEFDLDPWLICALSHQCGMVDFKDKYSLECLAESIDEIMVAAREKHKEYGIEKEPYIYIKADSGTYGMGIMTVNSASEIMELNKKERNKMQTIKEGVQVSEVIIQEGIETVDIVEGAPAEPMVYMIDGIPVGGMYRINGGRDSQNNLNAAGMRFTGMCDEVEDECGRWKKMSNFNFRSHGIIASIAALAAAREEY